MPEQTYSTQPDEAEHIAAATQPAEVVVNRNTGPELERRRNARLQSATLIVLATGSVLTLMYFAKPVLIVALVSVLLAFVLAPIVELLQRIRIPRSFGSLIAVCIMLGVCYGITYFSYYRAVAFVQELPKYSGKIRHTIVRVRKQAETFQKTTENVLPADAEDKNAVKVKQTSNWTDTLMSSAMNATEIVMLATFVPFLIYFMLSWQEHVRAATVMLFKMENRNTAYVTLGLISDMIRGFIVGNVIVGIFMGLASTIVFGYLHLPYFYFLGFISGFLSVVPYLGVVLAVVPPLVAGMGQIGSEDVLVIVVTVLALHLFALNVLYPKLIGKRLQLNPLAVTLALLFWGWLWGAMGLILAVPLTAAVKIIFDHIDSLRPYGAWLGE
ncbi:MAG TPA: AI-2E family transporter [Clostridia bacterium]|nr:AI-2E family transporter [Clostridia bacterium]